MEGEGKGWRKAGRRLRQGRDGGVAWSSATRGLGRSRDGKGRREGSG